MITVTTACPPVEDLRWAREHDIPMLKGIAAGPARAGVAAATTSAASRRPATSSRPRRSPARRAGRARLGRDRAALRRALRAGRAVRERRRGGRRRRADRLPGRRQDRQRRPQGAGRRRRPQPAGRGAGAGRGRADGRRGDRRRAGVAAASRCWSAWCATRTTGRPSWSASAAALAEALDLVTASLAPLDAEGARELVASLPALDRLLGGEAPDGLIDADRRRVGAGRRASRDRGDRRQPAAGVPRARRRARLPDRPEGK